MTTPTPDIVQRLRNRGHRIDLEAAATIEELREAVRVLGEEVSSWRRWHCDPRNRTPDKLDNEATKAVDANPIARDACEGTTA
jgi:hypothetical protein